MFTGTWLIAAWGTFLVVKMRPIPLNKEGGHVAGEYHPIPIPPQEYCKHLDCHLYLNHGGMHCTIGGTNFRDVSPYR